MIRFLLGFIMLLGFAGGMDFSTGNMLLSMLGAVSGLLLMGWAAFEMNMNEDTP